MTRTRLVFAPALVAGLLFAGLAGARPGGGQTYGGPSGGGGGDGAGELIFFLLRIWLDIVIHHPAFGIPATFVLIGLAWWIKTARRRDSSWDAGAVAVPPPPPPPPSVSLDRIRELDEAFSPVLFEDFVYALFARAHQARSSKKDLEALAPYLADGARTHLAQRLPAGGSVTGVVIGSMRVSFLSLPTGVPAGETQYIRVSLQFEANMTVAPEARPGRTAAGPQGGPEQTQYVRERWLLRRRSGTRSRPPESVGDFGCPSCGAPFEATPDNRCAYCDQVVTDGRFEWIVDQIVLLAIENRPPALTGTVPERGTQRPTIFQPHIDGRIKELFDSDPDLTVEAFGKRFGLTFHDLNAAWSGLDLRRARPFVSDHLFDYLQYWIAAYRQQRLRNVLEGFRITRWEFVKVTRDKYFDAITLRFWGAGRDSTVDIGTGKVVGGDASRERIYSEYWTFLRGRGVSGQATVDRSCPNCGATLDVNMAGVCAHCDSKITRGDFDWVLSKIEQDEAYSG